MHGHALPSDEGIHEEFDKDKNEVEILNVDLANILDNTLLKKHTERRFGHRPVCARRHHQRFAMQRLVKAERTDLFVFVFF